MAADQLTITWLCITSNTLILMSFLIVHRLACRDSTVVSTLRCGRKDSGSNPGHGMDSCCILLLFHCNTALTYSYFDIGLLAIKYEAAIQHLLTSACIAIMPIVS